MTGLVFSGNPESGYHYLESSGLKFLQILSPRLNFRQMESIIKGTMSPEIVC
jgi:hypothetical protein